MKQRIIMSRKEVFVIVARHLIQKKKLPESYGLDPHAFKDSATTAMASLKADDAPQPPTDPAPAWGDYPAMTFSWSEEVPE